MKKIFLLAFLIISIQSVVSQNFAWVQSWGGPTWDYSRSVATDIDGNVLVTGYFRNTIDADPGPLVLNLISSGQRDIFVSKFNASGRLLWAKQISGQLDETANELTTDSDGNVYVTGFYQGTVDFDPSPSVYNLITTSSNAYILKLDNSGNFMWVKTFDGGAPLAYDIAVDPDHNIYTTGRFNALTDFDPGPGVYNLDAYDYTDMFVCKMNEMGELLWVKQIAEIGDTASIRPISIAVDLQGNVLTTGFFNGTVDFDPGIGTFNLVSAGELNDVSFPKNVFVSKLDTDGNFMWAGSIAQEADAQSTGIAVDENNNIYTTGYFTGTVDFDPGASVFELNSNAMGANSFVCKLDPLGDFEWAKAFSGSTAVLAQGIEIHGNDLYTTGYFIGTIDFDPSTTTTNFQVSSGGSDLFVNKLDLDGNYQWAQKAGGLADENAYGVAINPTNGNVFVTGILTDTTDFDPSAENWGVNSHGEWDAFLVKFSECTPSIGITEVADACNQYTWMENDGLYTTSGIYWNILTSVSGCDSIVKLDLDLAHYDSEITFSGGYMSPLPNLFIDQFQWINCETFEVVETIGSFQPTVTGSYALISFAGDCIDTSNCIHVTAGETGIEELKSLGFSVYPNPVSDQLTIQSTNTLLSFLIEVTTVDGQLIYTETHSSGDKLSTQRWNAGFYFLKIVSGEKSYVTRIVKE